MLSRLRQWWRGHRLRRGLVELLVIAGVFLVLRAWLQQDMANGPVPPLAGTTLEGRAFDLRRYPERPVLVHFWATWCRICALEQDSIDAIARDWPVITVAMQSGSAADVQRHLRQAGLDFPVINDPDGTLARRFGVQAVPATFIVDERNRIVFRERGFTSEAGLRFRLWLAR